MTGSVLTKGAKELGRQVGSVAADKLEGLLNVGLWEIAQIAGIRGMFADTFASIEDSTNDEITGIAPKGIVDIMEKFIDTTLKISLIMDKEVAGELFGEMIQEGVSNAIQTSLGGAMQTIFNVKRGSFPAMQDYCVDVGKNADNLDEALRGIAAAMAGVNPITSAFDLMRGANDYIEQAYRYLSNQIENVTTYTNTEALGIIGNVIIGLNVLVTRLIHMPIEVAMVYHETVRRIAEEHLARVNELEDTLEAVRLYYENGYIDEATAEVEAAKIKAELDATEQSYNAFINSVATVYDDTITQIQNEVATRFADIMMVVTDVFEKLISIVNDVNSVNDAELKANIKDLIEKAYRALMAYRDFTATNIRFG